MHNRLDEFISYIEEKGTAENTRQAYRRDLKALLTWLEERGITELSEVGEAELLEYAEEMEASGKSASTVSRNIASLRKFFAYTESMGYTYSDPSSALRAPKVIRKAPDVLSEKDIKRLLNAPDVTTDKGIRDKAILELMVATGLCVSEIIDIRTEDVDLASRVILVGADKRRIMISRKIIDYLKDYSKVRRQFVAAKEVDDGCYFVSCAGDRLTRQGFWKIIRTCGNSVGINGLTPKMLRHSFAVGMLRRGKDVLTLQKMLGHRSKAGSLEYQSFVAAH